MPVFDEDEQRPPKPQIVGEDLSMLSEHELEERIGELESEIDRIRSALQSKRAGRDAAAALFKS